jgi:hypothetical protein
LDINTKNRNRFQNAGNARVIKVSVERVVATMCHEIAEIEIDAAVKMAAFKRQQERSHCPGGLKAIHELGLGRQSQ